MKRIRTQKANSGIDYIGYALYAFGGLGIEILLMMIETNLYRQPSEIWSATAHMIHWMITCFIWACLGIVLVKQLPSTPKNTIGKKNVILAIINIAASILITSLVWKGFKPMIEFSNLGMDMFLIQYIYYAFESLMIMLIVSHGQKAFEVWSDTIKPIPFGGILLAVTWGLIHIFTQGVSTGIYAVVQALLYGSIYVILNKSYKISYVAIAFMFML